MKEFDMYAEWTDKTAKYPPEAEPFYLALGIADEAGEFDAAFGDNVIKEAGDVLWYSARYATKVLSLSFSDVIAATAELTDSPEDVVLAVEVGTICGVEKKRIRDGEMWTTQVRHAKNTAARDALIRILAHISIRLEVLGLSLEAAARENINKLEKRLEGGTIQGDGDNR